MPASSNSVAQARLREALNAGGPGTKEKGPPVADGSLTVTPDTPEAIEFRSRKSVIDSLGASSSGYLEDETGASAQCFSMILFKSTIMYISCKKDHRDFASTLLKPRLP